MPLAQILASTNSEWSNIRGDCLRVASKHGIVVKALANSPGSCMRVVR